MLNRISQHDLTFEALVGLEDAAQILGRSLWRLEQDAALRLPTTLPAAKDLRRGLLRAMDKFRSPDEKSLSLFSEELMFFEVLREAGSWAGRLRASRVAEELERLRGRVLPDLPGERPDIKCFEDFLDEVSEDFSCHFERRPDEATLAIQPGRR